MLQLERSAARHESCDEHSSILVVRNDPGPGVSPGDDVVDRTGCFLPRLSRHRVSVPE
jgi:hypothetical protein